MRLDALMGWACMAGRTSDPVRSCRLPQSVVSVTQPRPVLAASSPPLPHSLHASDTSLVCRLLQAVDRAGYKKPSPIQMAAIPLGLQFRDVIGIAGGLQLSNRLLLAQEAGRARVRAGIAVQECHRHWGRVCVQGGCGGAVGLCRPSLARL